MTEIPEHLRRRAASAMSKMRFEGRGSLPVEDEVASPLTFLLVLRSLWDEYNSDGLEPQPVWVEVERILKKAGAI